MFLGTILIRNNEKCLAYRNRQILKIYTRYEWLSYIGWVVCACIYGCLAIPDRRGRQPTSSFDNILFGCRDIKEYL